MSRANSARLGGGRSTPRAGRSAEARVAAARALCELAGKTTKAQRRAVLPPLAANVKGPSRDVRRAAAEAMAYLDDARGTGVLMDWVCEPGMRGGDRLRAVRALERLTACNWGGTDEAAWKAVDAEAARKITLRIVRIKADLNSHGHAPRTVLAAREAALVAVQSILRWSFFEPDFPADNFTRRGADGAAAVAARLRGYWKANASVPLPRRMMNVLTDGDSPPAELRLAANNLAALGGRAIFGTMVGTSRLIKAGRGPSPAANMFEDPTAAEAILAAMDRDLGVFDAGFAGKLLRRCRAAR